MRMRVRRGLRVQRHHHPPTSTRNRVSAADYDNKVLREVFRFFEKTPPPTSSSMENHHPPCYLSSDKCSSSTSHLPLSSSYLEDLPGSSRRRHPPHRWGCRRLSDRETWMAWQRRRPWASDERRPRLAQANGLHSSRRRESSVILPTRLMHLLSARRAARQQSYLWSKRMRARPRTSLRKTSLPASTCCCCCLVLNLLLLLLLSSGTIRRMILQQAVEQPRRRVKWLRLEGAHFLSIYLSIECFWMQNLVWERGREYVSARALFPPKVLVTNEKGSRWHHEGLGLLCRL